MKTKLLTSIGILSLTFLFFSAKVNAFQYVAIQSLKILDASDISRTQIKIDFDKIEVDDSLEQEPIVSAALFVAHEEMDNPYSKTLGALTPLIPMLENFAQSAARLCKNKGCPGEVTMSVDMTGDHGCIGFYRSTAETGIVFTPDSVAASCISIPPINKWCAIVEPQIELNYGNINLDEAVGKETSTEIEVYCNSDVAFTIRLIGLSEIPLNNGMNAELSINGKPLLSDLIGIQGTNKVKLSSKLQGTPSVGAFNGSGLLYINYP